MWTIFAVFCDAAACYHEAGEQMASDYVTKGSVKDTTVKSAYWRIMRDCADTMRVVGGKVGLTSSDRAGIDLSEQEQTGPKYGAERILG